MSALSNNPARQERGGQGPYVERIEADGAAVLIPMDLYNAMKETEYLMASKEIKWTLRELQEHPFTGTGKNKFLITEKDFLLANRKASKEKKCLPTKPKISSLLI